MAFMKTKLDNLMDDDPEDVLEELMYHTLPAGFWTKREWLTICMERARMQELINKKKRDEELSAD